MAKERVFGDVCNLQGRLKELDPALVLSFNHRSMKYTITRGKHQVMTLNPGELDERVIRRLRENDLHRQRLEDYIYKLEQSELEHERRKARELSNKIESISLDNFDRVAGIPHYSLGGAKSMSNNATAWHLSDSQDNAQVSISRPGETGARHVVTAFYAGFDDGTIDGDALITEALGAAFVTLPLVGNIAISGVEIVLPEGVAVGGFLPAGGVGVKGFVLISGYTK